ncbi:CobW/HypB/UreG, nucleotide-binding domain-containing protein [Phyllosticta citribraziliensis]|uniref:CobW/HypB/UreG, nucleotide-binding domain-containing protein n=1 Tax=Phyllosticta citribraziliensis TaxID=989973 RepID=A0ABR1M5T4_9PEZI
MAPIPITIITGFLGSGKTTLILNLIPQLPADYKLALLKNEFGDVAIDSQLASSAAISGVQELLNGCICCNLTGQLGEALDELRNTANPDRVVIETSGSAFPATLAMEVNRLARETGNFVLDGVMSVVDVENWQGYEDTSYSAKVQAQYTDLIVLNKVELVSERRVEDVEDKIRDLELDVPTPIVKSTKGRVDKDIVFGLDAKLAKSAGVTEHHHDHDHNHSNEVEVLSVTLTPTGDTGGVDVEKLSDLLLSATKDEIYRIKAVLHATTPPTSSNGEPAASEASKTPARYILNWAFGRWTYTAISASSFQSETSSGNATPQTSQEPALRMTVITARYEANKWKKQIETRGFVALEGDAPAELKVDRVL